jgi:hypothetical protein
MELEIRVKMTLLKNFKKGVEATDNFLGMFFNPRYVVTSEKREIFSDYLFARLKAKEELVLINSTFFSTDLNEISSKHLGIIQGLISKKEDPERIKDLFFEHERIRDVLVGSFNSEKLKNWDFSGHNLRPYEERHEKRYELLRNKFYSMRNN